MVTNLELRDTVTHHLDHTGSLMTSAHRKIPHGHITSGNVIIGVAQASGHHTNQDFASAREVEFEFNLFIGSRHGRHHGTSGTHD
jgi:phosphoribosylaminoimidazole (AIR) synthetase